MNHTVISGLSFSGPVIIGPNISYNEQLMNRPNILWYSPNKILFSADQK